MYTPQPTPQSDSLHDLVVYVSGELDRLSGVLQEVQVDYIQFNVHYAAPDKPVVGQVYYADGTSWNPGTGEGLYLYTSAGWSKL